MALWTILIFLDVVRNVNIFYRRMAYNVLPTYLYLRYTDDYIYLLVNYISIMQDGR